MFFTYLTVTLSCIYELSRIYGTSDEIITEEKLNVFNFNSSKGIKICCHNVNRMGNKFEEIKYNLMNSLNPPDIIGCCETFLQTWCQTMK